MLAPLRVAAHEMPSGVRSVVDGTEPRVDGLAVGVRTSVTDQLVLESRTHVVEVLDPDGTPFLRIGPDGVEGNRTAAAFYRSNDPFGGAPVPEEARSEDEAEWVRIAQEPSWGWFDHRTHPGDLVVPEGARRADEATVLARWSIPLRVDGEAAEVRGHVELRPVRGAYRAELRGSGEVVPGVDLAVLRGRVPGLFLSNETDETVVVFGPDEEPFLRVDDGGTSANILSPHWHAVAQMRPELDLPQFAADAAASPRWRSVSAAPRYGWLEPRAHVAKAEPEDPSRRGVVRGWTIPVEVDEERAVVEGETLWVPTEPPASDSGGFPTREAVGGSLGLLLFGGALWARHRRVVTGSGR